MDPDFARDCDRAIFVYATALELGFRFATDGGRLWLDWPPDLSPAVLGPMRGAIERHLPFLIALVEEGLDCEGSARQSRAN